MGDAVTDARRRLVFLWTSQAARGLAARHGLVLDSTYGAKAFAFLMRRATCDVQRVVFWHTFGVPLL